MKKFNYKIGIASVLCCFFFIASVEIDVFEYDNTFFDTYDSYVKADSKLIQPVLTTDFAPFVLTEICFPCTQTINAINSFSGEPRVSTWFYRPKIFLILSSLLI